jgi:hypothetical protein
VFADDLPFGNDDDTLGINPHADQAFALARGKCNKAYQGLPIIPGKPRRTIVALTGLLGRRAERRVEPIRAY